MVAANCEHCECSAQKRAARTVTAGDVARCLRGFGEEMEMKRFFKIRDTHKELSLLHTRDLHSVYTCTIGETRMVAYILR